MKPLKWHWLLALAIAAALAGCAGTPSAGYPDQASGAAFVDRSDEGIRQALQDAAAMQDRLVRVASPLLFKNQESCKKLSRPLMGITARNKYSYSPEFADAAAQALGLGDRLQVTHVMAGSGAAKGGLQRGDLLVAVDETPMPEGARAELEAPRLLAPLLAEAEPIQVTIQRAGKAKVLSLTPTKACAFRIELGNADNVNSYADGQRIMVTRGMIRFVTSDKELAYVIAREMAHNALRHPARLNSADLAGDIIDALKPLYPQAGAENRTADLPAVPKEKDALADRLALHMLKRAGYDITGAAAFWKRLATQYPKTVFVAHTAQHPHTEYRLAAIEKTVAEIAARDGLPRSGPQTRAKRKARRR